MSSVAPSILPLPKTFNKCMWQAEKVHTLRVHTMSVHTTP